MGYMRRWQCINEGCDSLNGMSLSLFGQYQELGGGNVRVPGGFSRVIEGLRGKISNGRVCLDTRVTGVDWGGWVKEGESDRGAMGPCMVKCVSMSGDTKKYECEHVVITVSLGVLKDKDSMVFSPPLPFKKHQAIQRIGFGTTNKVFVRYVDTGYSTGGSSGRDGVEDFNVCIMRPWLPTNGIQEIQGLKDLERCSMSWAEEIFSFNREGSYLCSWLSGESSRAMESLPSQEVQERIVSVLRQVTMDPSWKLQGKFRGITNNIMNSPGIHAGGNATSTSIVRSTWASDPLFRGSYSYLPSGSTPYDIGELARTLYEDETLNGTLYQASAPVRCGDRGSDDGGSKGEGSDTAFGVHEGEVSTTEGGDYRNNFSLPSSRAPRVLFAGEATHPRFFSTAHGGFDSGLRAADEIIAWVKGSN
ncbi:unnamed protein product [Choristocarpus tenellus]